VTRLVEIGVEPFLVAPSIIGVMAQRLVRRICEHCKEPYRPPQETMDRLFEWDGHTDISFYRGKGCEDCQYTGFLGRLSIHEVFILNDEMRSLIARNASILDVRECAFRSGFRTMHYDGVKKVLRGLTTLEEVELAVLHAA
jgi:type IV pilus assembly protein PilB